MIVVSSTLRSIISTDGIINSPYFIYWPASLQNVRMYISYSFSWSGHDNVCQEYNGKLMRFIRTGTKMHCNKSDDHLNLQKWFAAWPRSPCSQTVNCRAGGRAENIINNLFVKHSSRSLPMVRKNWWKVKVKTSIRMIFIS